jgi:hypothetical protein
LLILENSFAALNIYITTTLKVDDEGERKKSDDDKKKFMVHHGRLVTQTILQGENKVRSWRVC